MRHLSFRSLPALAITSLLGTTALAQDYAAFVLDRSGSMASTRSGSSNTRAADSVAIALTDAWWHFLLHPTSQVLVYEFHGNAVTPIGGVHTTLAGVTAAINAVPPAGGNTPLAVALCRATDDLYNLNRSVGATRTLYLYSDGGENSSPSSSCRGTFPSSMNGYHCSQQGTSGAFDGGSWQQAICDIMEGKITSNFYYFDSFADDADPFVQAICDLTGGTLTRIPDASAMPMANPWRTSGVGCRDFHNTVLSMTHTGLPELGETVQIGCRTSSPLPYILGVGFSNTNNSSMGPLPIDLTPFGAPGCHIYSSWDVMDGFLPWNGERNVALPNSAAFRGMTLYYQGAQLHPFNNLFGVAFSNLLHMTII